MPPPSAQKPVTEPFQLFFIPSEKMNAQCNKMPGPAMRGCTVMANSERSAVIFINAGMTPADMHCTLIYEKAHLKPNSWFDPIAEARAPNLPGLADVSTLYPPAPIPMPRPAGRD